MIGKWVYFMIHTYKVDTTCLDIRDDAKISTALMSSFVILTIQYCILASFDLLDSNFLVFQIVSKLLVGLAYLSAFPVVLKRMKVKFVIIYLIAAVIFVLNILIFPENGSYLKKIIFPFFFTCLPTFIYTLSLKNWAQLKQAMKKASIIIFVFGFILFILIFTGRLNMKEYSMSFSYYMLIPLTIYLDEFFEKPSIKNLIFSLVTMLMILLIGSRGALLCIVVFVVLKLIRLDFKTSYKKMLLIGGIIIVLTITILYSNDILQFLYNYFMSKGIQSRSIILFLDKGLYLSGREILYNGIIKEILDNPIIGIGLAGDRRTIASYSHNIVLEIFSGFGLIVGTIILSFLAILILKSLTMREKEKYNMSIIWLALGFVSLMVSGSYLEEMSFWIFLGLISNDILIKPTTETICKGAQKRI